MFNFHKECKKNGGAATNYRNSHELDRNNVEGLLDKTWSPDNRDALFERPDLISDSYEKARNDRMVRDASYIRLKLLRLGYNIPSGLFENIGLGSFRIYAQGTNLWTITDWPGLDPETVVSGSGEGFTTTELTRSLNGTPLSQTFTLGAKFSF